MEFISGLSPFSSSSSRRFRQSALASVSVLKNKSNHSALQNAEEVGNGILFIARSSFSSSLVNLLSGMAKGITNVSPFISRLSSKDQHKHPNRLARFENDTRPNSEAVRLQHFAKFTKVSRELSNTSTAQRYASDASPAPHYCNGKKVVSRCRSKLPALTRPLHNHAEFGTWARQAINGACKAVLPQEEVSESDDFAGYEYEIDRSGNIVPRFLFPSAPSRYDIYKISKFNENLIFQFDR